MHPKADVDRLDIPRKEGRKEGRRKEEGTCSASNPLCNRKYTVCRCTQSVHGIEEELLKCIVNERIINQLDGKTSEEMKQEEERTTAQVSAEGTTWTVSPER